MINKDNNIGDDEFYVIGQREREKEAKKAKILKWLKIIAFAGFACAIAVLLGLDLYHYYTKKVEDPTGNPVKTNTGNISDSIKERYIFQGPDPTKTIPYTERFDTIVDDLPITLYFPRNAKPSLIVKTPDMSDVQKYVLAFRAADIREDNGKIAGAFVIKGDPIVKENSVSKRKKGFCAIIDHEITIGSGEKSTYFDKAIESQGYFYRHFSLVENGKAVNDTVHSSKTRRGALCSRNGEIFFVDNQYSSMNDLAKVLETLGVENAILTMGYIKSFGGWWRDLDGKVELFRTTEEYTSFEYENYIVWE